MKPRSNRNLKRGTANFFGAFGYLFSCLQWFWAIMLFFSIFQSVGIFLGADSVPSFSEPSPQVASPPSALQLIILAVIVAIMIGITVYALVKIPMGIVKTGNKVVRQTAKTMTPVVAKVQHKPVTKKSRRKITVRLVIAVKLLLIAIPLAATALSGLLDKQSIDYAIAMILGGGLAGFALLSFGLQYALAGILRVKLSELR
jgi:hypothetical protein